MARGLQFCSLEITSDLDEKTYYSTMQRALELPLANYRLGHLTDDHMLFLLEFFNGLTFGAVEIATSDMPDQVVLLLLLLSVSSVTEGEICVSAAKCMESLFEVSFSNLHRCSPFKAIYTTPSGFLK